MQRAPIIIEKDLFLARTKEEMSCALRALNTMLISRIERTRRILMKKGNKKMFVWNAV
jgi:hypothetical protein